MAIERTLSIIKPDAVAKNVIGEIIARFEKAGLNIVGAKLMKLSEEKAGGFYAEHKERPFFGDLVGFKTLFFPIALTTLCSVVYLPRQLTTSGINIIATSGSQRHSVTRFNQDIAKTIEGII